MVIKMSVEDWRYSDEKMEVRVEALSALLSNFGGVMDGFVPKYSNQSLYECAHDWVSQGNMNADGIVKYYQENYAD